MRSTVFHSIWILILTGSTLGQSATDYVPPHSQQPDLATLTGIKEKQDKLGQSIQSLRRQGIRDPYLADVEVFYKAAVWIQKHDEFYDAKSGAWTAEILDRGLVRAAQIGQGEAPWMKATGQTVVRGYRSRVDESVQPYAVTYPTAFGQDPNRKWRVDIILHGRNKTLTEVGFMQSHADRPAPKDLNAVQVEVYGRGNNAYRWAGESDVIEVIDHFDATETQIGRKQFLDPSRVVLRGFSMGGAGAWHLGLHMPSRWCLIGPGAGFTTTRGYIRSLPEKLPPEQEACLHIYDAVDYAENAFNVPVIAYAGENDGQLQASRNIEAKTKPMQIPMQILVAPGMAHKFPPEWQKKAEEAYAPFLKKGKPDYPPHVRFVTYTMRYPSCAWVELMALEEHYKKSIVDAQCGENGITAKTTNVRQLHLILPPAVPQPFSLDVDGQSVAANPTMRADGSQHVYLEKIAGIWHTVSPSVILTERIRTPMKVRGLQGPIDDAFMDSFLCVRGSGTAWNDGILRHANARLTKFEQEWDKYMRGKLVVKEDTAVTEAEMSSRNLILFGDPGSNALIRQALSRLPLTWTSGTLTWNGKNYSAKDHMPVLIFPSPFSANHYVVLNTGHTFGEADFQGTNALLYPRLGDYAILKTPDSPKENAAAEVIVSGLFNDFWRLPGK